MKTVTHDSDPGAGELAADWLGAAGWSRRAHWAVARTGNALLRPGVRGWIASPCAFSIRRSSPRPAASFRLAGLQRITRDGYLATVRCVKRGGVSAFPGGISLPQAGRRHRRASQGKPAVEARLRRASRRSGEAGDDDHGSQSFLPGDLSGGRGCRRDHPHPGDRDQQDFSGDGDRATGNCGAWRDRNEAPGGNLVDRSAALGRRRRSAMRRAKRKEPRTLEQYLSSLKEPPAADVRRKDRRQPVERQRGDRPIGGRLQGGAAERFDHRENFRADDRQPDRDGECATFSQCQLRDHRFAGRSEDQGRLPTVLAHLQLSAQRPGAGHLELDASRARFRGRWSPSSRAEPWWWRRATRSWQTTSIRTSPCGGSCGPGTSLRTTAFSLRK